MTSPTFDVVIIGAGIVGSACAAECINEGLKTAIVEAKIIGGGATAAGMGHLVVMDDSEAQFALTSYSCKLWSELKEDLPPSIEYEACGTIWVAADDEEMAEVRRKEKYYTERGVPVQVLDAKALDEAEPNLRTGLAGGLRVPNDCVIYPPCAAQFFVDRAVSNGATLILGKKVKNIQKDGVRIDDDTFLSSGLVVNATGSWAPLLTSGIDVKKRKGHLLITDRYPGFVKHQLVELGYLKSAHSVTDDSVAFNIQPRKTGQMLIGSSRQYGIESSQIDTPILRRMLNRAIEYMPDLANLSSIRTWTGFRAATPDKLPLIGPDVLNSKLYLATGHEGLGITTSLGTAKLLVDQIVSRRSAIPIAPYLPARVSELSHA
ncbi:MAG TPA: FAD-dependent oxidoreductase [Pyrinomonadaceae bacterium]|jgi:glycine/D-amino acid oxidase-like deaminating enzyme|nr:FAD-dependent oxidoreductase [Pyrinomonadaceae bacterium]